MKAIEKFRKYLSSGHICLGTSVTFNDPLVTDALADSVDFIWIELEHCNMSPETLNGHLLAARSKNVPLLVRVPGSSTPYIKHALDSGAGGIVVPQVRSVEEVKKVVEDCRYPPPGRRGYGPRIPSNYDRSNSRKYIQWANENIFVAVMIETAEALGDIDRILAVPGLDSVVIGPMDLSGALGVLGDIEHPSVIAAIDEIVSKTRKAGLAAGCGVPPDARFACEMVKRGIQWMQVGNDFHYLTKYACELISSIRCGIKNSGKLRFQSTPVKRGF